MFPDFMTNSHADWVLSTCPAASRVLSVPLPAPIPGGGTAVLMALQTNRRRHQGGADPTLHVSLALLHVRSIFCFGFCWSLLQKTGILFSYFPVICPFSLNDWGRQNSNPGPRISGPLLDTFRFSVRHPFRLRRGSADVITFPSGWPLRQGAYAGAVISSRLLMLQRAEV